MLACWVAKCTCRFIAILPYTNSYYIDIRRHLNRNPLSSRVLKCDNVLCKISSLSNDSLLVQQAGKSPHHSQPSPVIQKAAEVSH